MKRNKTSLGKILIAQGGGPTAVINQSLVGVVLEARQHLEFECVYGACHGVRGILTENFVDLSKESEDDLENVAATPSSALGSSRHKPDVDDCEDILKVLKAHDIRHFFYIGGNDSAETVRLIAQEAQKQTYSLTSIHIPKTIDNDLIGSDHTPGFPSAARFVVQAFIGANLNNISLLGVYVGVVMGRNSGFLTAASALARKFPDDGPHLIYMPERAFVMEKFLQDVHSVYERHGRCVIAVSEGIRDVSGNLIGGMGSENAEHDAYGNLQLSGSGVLADMLSKEIRNKLRIEKVRGDTFGYLQRSFIGCASEVDQREARTVGQRAVQFALTGHWAASIAIKRTDLYSTDYELI
jgi:6-phosphofructokinase 1